VLEDTLLAVGQLDFNFLARQRIADGSLKVFSITLRFTIFARRAFFRWRWRHRFNRLAGSLKSA
jgi:hypothetical protein